MLGTGVEFYLVLLLFAVPGIAIGFTVHEYCHARVATSYGDPTPRAQGRLSLNPANQIDPLGLACLVLIGLGFARPVQYNPLYVRRGGQRAWLSAAGPLSNLLVAALLCVFLRLLILADPQVQSCLLPSFDLTFAGYLYWILIEAFFVNIILFIFNLVPIPPLDGYGVAEGLFGSRAPHLFQWIDRNRSGILIAALLLFFVLPNFFNSGFSIGAPIFAAADWLWRAVVSGTPPYEIFPNLNILISPASQGLATALANPCAY
ncbi:MAG TPA: site-2 protease family protein [Candidatus Dormibacteraeota bacterium]|nr:site-2 protease family protein [Candidatus Dormibacteraeota bacterium]